MRIYFQNNFLTDFKDCRDYKSIRELFIYSEFITVTF
jgi:hypothetical protein